MMGENELHHKLVSVDPQGTFGSHTQVLVYRACDVRSLLAISFRHSLTQWGVCSLPPTRGCIFFGRRTLGRYAGCSVFLDR